MNRKPGRALLALATAGAIASAGMLAGTGTASAHGDHEGGHTHIHGTSSKENCEIGRAWHWQHTTSFCFRVASGEWTFIHYA